MAEGVCYVLNGRRRVQGRVLAVYHVIGPATPEAVPGDVAQILLGRNLLEDLDVSLLDVRKNPSLKVVRMGSDELLEDADSANCGGAPDAADAIPPNA